MGLTQRASTHTAQKHFTETEAAAKDFIAMMQVKMQEKNLDHLNMDQTPIPYSYHASKTLEFKGAKTVQARSPMSDTKRVTLAVAVTASGKLLPPFMIFKGQRHGCIAAREFATYPGEGKYAACQPKAWMDKAMMN